MNIYKITFTLLGVERTECIAASSAFGAELILKGRYPMAQIPRYLASVLLLPPKETTDNVIKVDFTRRARVF